MESLIQKNILIITPSLDPQENISGISTISRLLIEGNKTYQYHPFIVGKKDKERRDLSWLLSLMRKPFSLCFSRLKGIDLVHFNIGFEPRSLIRDFFLFMIPLQKSIPIVLHIHGGRYMNRNTVVFRPIIIFFLKYSNKIIVLSELEKKILLKNYANLKADKIYVEPNSIVLPDYSVEEKDFISTLTISFLGRIDKAKGLSKILSSLSLMKEKKVDFIFNLCGTGSDKVWFMENISENLKENIKDRGVIWGKEKDTLLKETHIFLLPSEFEGLPLALLESMSYYIVPVVSPVGSIPDVVIDSNGILVKTTEEISQAIVHLDNNREILKKLAIEARKTVEERFSLSVFVKHINLIYDQVLSSASVH